MALKALLALFWLLILPLTLGDTLAMGYVILFCVMEVLAVPAIFLKLPLHVLSTVYGGVLLVLAVFILIKKREEKKEALWEGLAFLKEGSWGLYLALVLILFQCAFVCLMAHMDADDAFYVGTAVTDVAKDSIYQINPYTGFAYDALPRRYTLSPFPVFLSVISQLCLGMHPSVVAHVFFPPFFLLVIYSVLSMAAEYFFPKEASSRGLFLFFSAVLLSFSSWSIYNAGNFAMIRIWQGKAFLAGAFLPLLWLVATEVLLEGKRKGRDLFFTLLACCHLSSMGIALSPVVEGCILLAALLLRKPKKRLLTGLICLLPPVVLGIFYVLYW